MRFRSAFCIVLTFLLLQGCRTESRVLDVRVIDSAGEPIGGAIFYAEAFTYDEQGFDFAWGRSDSDGEIHQVDGSPLSINWKSGAKLSYAAFAAGMKPSGFIDYIGRATDSSFAVILYDTSETDLDYQPVIAKLSFPFESNSNLAKRLNDPANHELLLTFRSAYEPLVSGSIPSMPEERAKLAFLDSLIARTDSGE